MSLSLEEMREYIDNARYWAAKSPTHGPERIRQLKERAAVGQKMSEVITDPRWEVYGRHIEAMRDHYSRRAQAARIKILNGFLKGDAYLDAKMEQLKADSAVQALTEALTIAKTLIERGEEAVKELNQNEIVKEEKRA